MLYKQQRQKKKEKFRCYKYNEKKKSFNKSKQMKNKGILINFANQTIAIYNSNLCCFLPI